MSPSLPPPCTAPHERDSVPGAGRILRVKAGYNPNSSSVGSLIPVFLGAATALGALAAVGMQLLAARRGSSGEEAPADPPPPSDDPAGSPSP